MKKSLLITNLLFILILFSCEESHYTPSNDRVASSKHICSSEDLPQGDITSGVALVQHFWPHTPNKPTIIRVKFMNGQGSPFVRKKVEEYAKQWELYGNIKFIFVSDQEIAHIRITFNTEKGTLSYIGRQDDSVEVQNIATMNYGWLNDSRDEKEFARVILHEFGHALGLQHEQTNPNSVVKDEILLRGEEPRYDISDPYVFSSEYDKLSIMHYPYSREKTIDKSVIADNYKLSDGDKALIQQIYPFSGNRTIFTEKRIYTLEGVLDIFKDIPTGKIIFYPLHGKVQIDPTKNDSYKIVDGDRNTAVFTSRTRFPKRRYITKLKNHIIIYKNGDYLHERWLN